MRVFVDTHDTKRVYIAHPGSLGTILVILITGLLLAVFFVLLLGTLLIWLPAMILLATAVIVVGLVRKKTKLNGLLPCISSVRLDPG